MSKQALDPLGIDPRRLYFREDIALLWGYDLGGGGKRDDDRLRKWFHRHFTANGLRVCKVGNRLVIHGEDLAVFVRHHAQVRHKTQDWRDQ